MNNYDGAIGALNNMNALLTDDYMISIDTDEYERKMAAEKFYQCNFCTTMEDYITNPDEEEPIKEKRAIPTEIPISEVHVFDLKTDFVESVLSKCKSKKAWICPKCRNINKLSNTNVVKTERIEPFYLGVIPTPPRFSSLNRMGFEKKFREYYNNYCKELEHAMMLYRIDYIKETGEDMTDSPFRDTGDK